jgi:hypothetical protein
VRYFFLAIGFIFNPLLYFETIVNHTINILLFLMTAPLIVFYPLTSFFVEPSPLDPISLLIGGWILLIDTFINGGMPQFIDPPAGNVMHIIYNITRIDQIILKLAIALSYFGLQQKGIIPTVLFYAQMNSSDRKLAWKIYGIETPAEEGGGTGGGDFMERPKIKPPPPPPP